MRAAVYLASSPINLRMSGLAPADPPADPDAAREAHYPGVALPAGVNMR